MGNLYRDAGRRLGVGFAVVLSPRTVGPDDRTGVPAIIVWDPVLDGRILNVSAIMGRLSRPAPDTARTTRSLGAHRRCSALSCKQSSTSSMPTHRSVYGTRRRSRWPTFRIPNVAEGTCRRSLCGSEGRHLTRRRVVSEVSEGDFNYRLRCRSSASMDGSLDGSASN